LRRWLPAALLLLFLPASPARAQAGPAAGFPLAASLDGMPQKILVGEPFALELRVENRGPAAASSRITFRIPTAFLLAGRPNCAWTFEPADRRWETSGLLAPGETTACRMEFLAPDDLGAAFLAVEMQVFPADLSDQLYQRADFEVPLASKPPSGKVLFRIGGIGFRWLELGILLFFALFFGFFLLGRRRGRRYGAAAVAVLCLFFLAFFGFMAGEDWRIAQEFRQASCEVLDTEVVVNLNKSDSKPKKSYESYDARLVVGYELDGQRRVALAGRPDSHLDLSASKVAELMEGFASGRPVPCWVDPQDSGKVLVDKGPGGAYLFALIPLGVLAFMFYMWRRK
jgi:hypothetical protein